MSDNLGDHGTFTRRQALLGSTWALAAASAAGATRAFAAEAAGASESLSFHGTHQSGVTTRIQSHLVFAAFDVTTSSRAQLATMLSAWTAAAARFAEGRELRGPHDIYLPPADTGETRGLSAAGLTVTFGYGPSLFDERLGLTRRRPAALVDLPAFPGDRLDPLRSNGDICVQACADDPIVALHAVRNLARLGLGTVATRYIQLGSGPTSTSSGSAVTPRNLLGFKDGTNNLAASSQSAMDDHVWVGDESDQDWMVGGTYLVARRIRVHLEEWSSLALVTQQQTIGRSRDTGAPLGEHREHAPLDLAAVNHAGEPVIPLGAHVRVAAGENNGGAKILRRGFNFADGIDPTTGELDAGLMFICFQKDPRRQFIVLQGHLASADTLSNYVVHSASGIFACPPGAAVGQSIGEGLF